MARIIMGLIGAAFLIGANGCGTAKSSAQVELISCSGAQIVGKCLLRSYQEGAAAYVTDNQHTFCPESLRFEVVSNEPQGKETWLLNWNNFTASVKSNSDKKALYNKESMQALLFSMSSSAELLSGLKLVSDNSAKVEGKWYDHYAYSMDNTIIELFQNKTNKRFELVTVKNSDSYLQAYSYNLWYDKNLGRQIARSVDIFDISDGLASKKMIMQVQYISVETVGK